MCILNIVVVIYLKHIYFFSCMLLCLCHISHVFFATVSHWMFTFLHTPAFMTIWKALWFTNYFKLRSWLHTYSFHKVSPFNHMHFPWLLIDSNCVFFLSFPTTSHHYKAHHIKFVKSIMSIKTIHPNLSHPLSSTFFLYIVIELSSSNIITSSTTLNNFPWSGIHLSRGTVFQFSPKSTKDRIWVSKRIT